MKKKNEFNKNDARFVIRYMSGNQVSGNFVFTDSSKSKVKFVESVIGVDPYRKNRNQ